MTSVHDPSPSAPVFTNLNIQPTRIHPCQRTDANYPTYLHTPNLATVPFSQAFYRQELDLKAMGYSSLEDFLVAFWEGFFLPKDANNLLSMLWTWQHGDISANELYGGDLPRALAAIKAKAFVMPGQTDLYFPPEDSEAEVSLMPNARLIPIPSVWGHFAGGPGTSPDDAAFIDARLKELLES